MRLGKYTVRKHAGKWVAPFHQSPMHTKNKLSLIFRGGYQNTRQTVEQTAETDTIIILAGTQTL